MWTIPLPSYDVTLLVCSFSAAYYYKLLRGTLPFPLCVFEPWCISLDSLQVGHALASEKFMILTSMIYHDQGTTLLPTIGTPTPNGLKSSWDFLPGISLDMLVGLEPLTFLVLEGGPDVWGKCSPRAFWVEALADWKLSIQRNTHSHSHYAIISKFYCKGDVPQVLRLRRLLGSKPFLEFPSSLLSYTTTNSNEHNNIWTKPYKETIFML